MAWPASVHRRDPVSEAFDDTARRLLERAYRQRGQWITVRLKDPTMRQRTRWAAEGINVDGPDNPSVRGGRGLDAKTRWARALVRSLNYVNKHETQGAPLRFEVGRHIPASPQFDPRYPERGGFPPSRQFRFQVARGGSAAMRAVQRKPDSERIWTDDGGRGERFSRRELRDWL